LRLGLLLKGLILLNNEGVEDGGKRKWGSSLTKKRGGGYIT